MPIRQRGNMKENKPKAALIYRIIGLIISFSGVVLHMMADNVIKTGFMVQHKLAYFTIQTNIFIAILFAVLVIKTIIQTNHNKKLLVAELSPGLQGALTFYITMTMLCFWIILAPTNGLPANSFLFFTTIILHTITPLLAIGDFFLFVPHGKLQKKHALIWLSYPIIYLVFIMIYSKMITEPYYILNLGGKDFELMFPYIFLDSNIIGGWGVAASVVALAGIFYLLSRLFIKIDNKIAR